MLACMLPHASAVRLLDMRRSYRLCVPSLLDVAWYERLRGPTLSLARQTIGAVALPEQTSTENPSHKENNS
jgi:hypothetical protein